MTIFSFMRSAIARAIAKGNTERTLYALEDKVAATVAGEHQRRHQQDRQRPASGQYHQPPDKGGSAKDLEFHEPAAWPSSSSGGAVRR